MAPYWTIFLPPQTEIPVTQQQGCWRMRVPWLAIATPGWLRLPLVHGKASPHTMNMRGRDQSMQSRKVLHNCTKLT